MDIAMVITVVSTMYLVTRSIHYDKMSGIAESVIAAMAVAVIVLEVTAYAVILLPTLHWAASAAVFLSVTTLFTTCSLARMNGSSAEARNKLRDNSR